MKFAKDLEREAVPEWRIKYLNYKAGKKYIKSVSRAIARANTPSGNIPLRASTFLAPLTPRQPVNKPKHSDNDAAKKVQGNGASATPNTPSAAAIAKPIPSSGRNENDSLTGTGDNRQYGSINATPDGLDRITRQATVDELELPDPAIEVQPNAPTSQQSPSRPSPRRSLSMNANSSSGGGILKRSTTANGGSPKPLRRLFTHNSNAKDDAHDNDEYLLDVVREREQEFFHFLDVELDKVETFYKMKEEQAGQRLNALRVQLHEMRNRRIQEMALLQLHEDRRSENGSGSNQENGNDKLNDWVAPLRSRIFPMGPNSVNLQNMGQTPSIRNVRRDSSRDYIRRPDPEVSYRTAKRKLKLALQEFYRGLELLKSYAMLNRTAFRKLNKKYDKAVNARPPYRYMNEKVNRAWFVNSDVLENHIQVVEDLYARYFERGNHKLAAGKLRKLNKKPEDQSVPMFQNGLLIGTGAVFAIQGLVYGAQHLFDGETERQVHTAFLLQIYGGYFLMLFLFSLFCIDCALWTRYKVNYPFIFEFDQRHSLDWRELAQFPSFCFLMLGLIMWINFSGYGTPEMYIYYPVILIFATFVIIFFPARVLFYKSRKWYIYSHWRLLLAGLYPVEFRDFFLGDIYCSLTYATANIELFFCLYANNWGNPTQCNSSHSRLLGFLTALPPIWRLLQCLRRYKDTRNIFPHLVNGGKYTATIVAAVTLSMYRISGTRTNLGLFIAFSAFNSIYCCIWDLFMDFSLLQPHSKYPGLRDILAFKRRWIYYIIMVVDPILRFAWILYAIFTYDTQHSTVVSFLVGFLEVMRRGMWTLFRVENEHCANVAQYKASRDVPLPYRIEPLIDRTSTDALPSAQQDTAAPASRLSTATATGASSPFVEEGVVRRRTDAAPSRRTFSRILAEAHKQDFEKRRRPVDPVDEDAANGAPSDDDDDGDSDSLLARDADNFAHNGS